MARYPRKFTESERTALLAADVGTLYQMGVNAYLMGYPGRYGVFGLTVESCSIRVRRAQMQAPPGHRCIRNNEIVYFIVGTVSGTVPFRRSS